MEAISTFEKPPELQLERVTATEHDIAKFIELESSAEGLRTYSPMTEPREVNEAIEKEDVFFIRSGDQVVGNVSYERISPTHGYISGLIVRPEFQGQGIGRRAMVAVLKELRNVPYIDLVTHPDNERAIALYESLGFKRGEVKQNYFDDGEPRMVMSLQREV